MVGALYALISIAISQQRIAKVSETDTRDYFAGLALQGLIAHHGDAVWSEESEIQSMEGAAEFAYLRVPIRRCNDGSEGEAMSRFWRFKDYDLAGEFLYVDPAEIIAVERITLDDDDKRLEQMYYTITIRSGEWWRLHDDDGVKLLRWAEANAEEIPTVPLDGAWR